MITTSRVFFIALLSIDHIFRSVDKKILIWDFKMFVLQKELGYKKVLKKKKKSWALYYEQKTMVHNSFIWFICLVAYQLLMGYLINFIHLCLIKIIIIFNNPLHSFFKSQFFLFDYQSNYNNTNFFAQLYGIPNTNNLYTIWLVSLFNATSNFMGYLIPTLSLCKNSSSTI